MSNKNNSWEVPNKNKHSFILSHSDNPVNKTRYNGDLEFYTYSFLLLDNKSIIEAVFQSTSKYEVVVRLTEK